MQVQELMTRDVAIVSAGDNIRAAARRMAELNVGVLPVGDEDRLVGMITDRDIVVPRGCEGKHVTTRVKELMTPGMKYCFGGSGDRRDICKHGGYSGPAPPGPGPRQAAGGHPVAGRHDRLRRGGLRRRSAERNLAAHRRWAPERPFRTADRQARLTQSDARYAASSPICSSLKCSTTGCMIGLSRSLLRKALSCATR